MCWPIRFQEDHLCRESGIASAENQTTQEIGLDVEPPQCVAG